MKKTVSKFEERIQVRRKAQREIWAFMRIEMAIKKYGFSEVKNALSKWVQYQRETKKLREDRAELQKKLAEIEAKL